MSTQFDGRCDEDAIDLRVLLIRLWEKRWWLVLSVVLSTAAFLIAAFTITPVYRASILLMPASAERNSASGSLSAALGQLGGLTSLVGAGGSSDTGTEEALAVLRSREFTRDFIADKQLMPVLFAEQWDLNNKKWKSIEYSPTESSAYKYFSQIRTVIQDKKTGLVTIQVDWTDRILAAEWANQLIERLNAEMRSRAVAKADASLGFLQKEVATTSILEVREAINRLIEAQIKQRMLANVTQEYSFRVIDKAVPPDSNDRIKPNKLLLAVMGPIVGLALGILVVFMSDLIGDFRRSLRNK